MLRSAQPSRFSTYPIQNIDIPDLAVLFMYLNNFGKFIVCEASPSQTIDCMVYFPVTNTALPTPRAASQSKWGWTVGLVSTELCVRHRRPAGTGASHPVTRVTTPQQFGLEVEVHKTVTTSFMNVPFLSPSRKDDQDAQMPRAYIIWKFSCAKL